MKRVTLWACTAFLTFFTGVGCVLMWLLGPTLGEGWMAPDLTDSPLTFEAEPLDLPFCHLIIAPENYAGRVVRVQATYVMGMHGPVLLDRSCSSPHNSVWVSLSPASWEETERAMENAYGTKEVSGPLGVVAVGRFERNVPSGGSDSLADNAPYKFELVRIERAVRPR